MKKILLALLLLTAPAWAQTTTGGNAKDGVFKSITTAGDALVVTAPGWQWASVKVTFGSFGSAVVSTQISIDGGVNWFAPALAKQVDVGAGNPVLTPLQATTVGPAQWEIPLPANTTHFRISCGGSGTAQPTSVIGFVPYVPSITVSAVLYDTTSAVNTAIDTGTLDVSGWEYVNVMYVTPAGGSGTISQVDDTGASLTMFTPPASANAWYPFAMASPSVSQLTALPATGSTGALPIQKRMRFQSAAVAALTSRIRIEVRR